MSGFYKEWKEAHTAAIDLARQCNCDAAVWKANEYGRKGFTIGLLPRPENSFGRDAQAERVKPSDPR